MKNLVIAADSAVQISFSSDEQAKFAYDLVTTKVREGFTGFVEFEAEGGLVTYHVNQTIYYVVLEDVAGKIGIAWKYQKLQEQLVPFLESNYRKTVDDAMAAKEHPSEYKTVN